MYFILFTYFINKLRLKSYLSSLKNYSVLETLIVETLLQIEPSKFQHTQSNKFF